jgi:hypothetical protein
MRTTLFISLGTAALITFGASKALAAPAACDAAELQKKAPKDTTLLAARVVAAKEKVPEHCFVEGNVATPGNVVDFKVALPTNWNGKFIFDWIAASSEGMPPQPPTPVTTV